MRVVHRSEQVDDVKLPVPLDIFLQGVLDGRPLGTVLSDAKRLRNERFVEFHANCHVHTLAQVAAGGNEAYRRVLADA